jgi:Flp pilus assembly protein TadG
MATQRRRLAQKGISLIVGTASMALLIPSAGLAVDAALLYYMKGRLQGAVDGAALAAARSLTLGATTVAQSDSAKQNAVNWFYANFPTAQWGTSSTQMDQTMVTVTDDPNNANLRNVAVQANTRVSTIFMRWFNIANTVVAAQGTASRRDVVIMMVLDRSGSMNTTGSCPDLRAAAKVFTGQFAATRDRIGLVSFSDGTYIHSSPTTDFRTQLGFDDGVSTGTGTGNAAIDSIVCEGGTGTAEAITVAYNELYKMNLPGALNILLIETDGLPNTLALNFGWDTTTNATAITGSGCLDNSSPNRTKSGGGWNTSSAQRIWSPAHSMGPNGFMGDIPAGAYGSLFSQDPNQTPGNFLYALINPWHTNPTQGFTASGSSASLYPDTTTPGCYFDGASNNHANMMDFAWIPPKDIFGNSLNPSTDPYASVTMTGTRVALGANAWQNYHNAALNATIDAAYRARTNATLPVTIFVIGLGGNSTGYTPDYTLMQRIANDVNGDGYNTPTKYNPCPTQPNCVNYPTQPQGTFIWSVDKTELRAAFLKLSSQILRLSK